MTAQHILVTADTLDAAINDCLCPDDNLLIIDSEQTTLDVFPDQDFTVCTQLGPRIDTAYVFPARFRSFEGNIPIDMLKAAFTRVWEAAYRGDFRLGGANIFYDLDALHTWHQRYWPKRCLEDTVIKAWIQDPTKSKYGHHYGLKEQVERRLGVKMLRFQDLVPTSTKTVQHPRLPLTETVEVYDFAALDPGDPTTLAYAAEDVIQPRPLLQAIKLTPSQQYLYQVELATGEHVRRYRANQHWIDVDRALSLHASHVKRIDIIEQEVAALLPEVELGTNLRPRQLCLFWRDCLVRIGPPKKTPGTWSSRYRGPSPKTGKEIWLGAKGVFDEWGLDIKTRAKIQRDPLASTEQKLVAKLLDEQATLEHDVCTYLVQALAVPASQRLRYDMRTHGQDTARFSGVTSKARSPWAMNVAAIPKVIRQVFGAPPGTHLYASLDAAVEEPRILANFCGSGAMQRTFLARDDFHRLTAAIVHAVSEAEVTAAQRSRGKTVGLSLFYNKTAEILQGELFNPDGSPISLDQTLQIIDRVFGGYVDARRWSDAMMLRMLVKGTATSMFGRHIPTDRPEGKTEKLTSCFADACNSHVQTSASDIMRIAIDRAMRFIDEQMPGSYLVGTLHDAVDLHVRYEHVRLLPQLSAALQEACTPPSRLIPLIPADQIVPMIFDVQVGFSWGQQYKYGETQRKTFEGDLLHAGEWLSPAGVVHCDRLAALYGP